MLNQYAERYRRDLRESVIPFWLNHSLDREHGGYFTCLDREGAVYDTKKYVWLQGRAIWMFSRLYNELERDQRFLDAAQLGVDFLRRYGRDPQGRVYFSLTRAGAPYFFQRKPYSAVFYMLGLLEYGKAANDQSCLEEAVEVFWRCVDWVEHPALLDRPAQAGQVATSNLANVLVLGMMAYELAKVFDDQRYRQIMQSTIDSAMRHYDHARGVFLENIALDGRDLSEWPEGRMFSPGHSIETAWIVLDLLTMLPDQVVQQCALRAIERSIERGWDQEYGGLYYFMDIAGQPTLQLEATMKLWWPHAETIYALVRAYALTSEARWLTLLEQVDSYAYAHFVDREHGEWFGYCDRRGELALSCKGGNYKGFYHVPRALLFSVQCIEKLSI